MEHFDSYDFLEKISQRKELEEKFKEWLKRGNKPVLLPFPTYDWIESSRKSRLNKRGRKKKRPEDISFREWKRN